MKPIKRRMDIRLKKRLFEKIKTISEIQDKTWTDVIETALEYGLKWYEAKIKRELAQQKEETKPVQTQQNNTTSEDDEEEYVDPEELTRQLKALDEQVKKKRGY